MIVKIVEQSSILNYFKGVVDAATVCADDLMKYKVGKHHPYYSLLTNWVVTEVNLQLGLGHYNDNEHFKLAVALDNSGGVVAFATFTTSTSHQNACGINYIATLPEFRRRGLMRSLVELIKSNYSDVSLSCGLDLIPYYTALGFYLTAPEGTQVSLSTVQSAAVMPVLSEAIILESPPISKIMENLNKKYGKRLKDIHKAYTTDRKRAEKHIAKEFQRLVMHST